MKIKFVLLATLVLAFSLSGPAQTKGGDASRTAAEQPEVQEIQGELQVGKTSSLILYVGMETGDYAAYCFTNKSRAGRTILAACRNRGQCKVKARVVGSDCQAPGLKATLSASFRIVSVQSAQPARRRR